MAVFKFRYWHTEKAVMVYSEDWTDAEFLQLPTFAEQERLMQAIGISALDGHMIYEGDIVAVYNTYKEEHFRGRVAFKHGQFLIIKPDLTSHFRWINYEVHVIGNQFAQPQLWMADEADDATISGKD